MAASEEEVRVAVAQVAVETVAPEEVWVATPAHMPAPKAVTRVAGDWAVAAMAAVVMAPASLVVAELVEVEMVEVGAVVVVRGGEVMVEVESVAIVAAGAGHLRVQMVGLLDWGNMEEVARAEVAVEAGEMEVGEAVEEA